MYKGEGVRDVEDREIVELYMARDLRALKLTEEKYGGYLSSVAGRILDCPEDAEECVNDAYMRAWSSIPPGRPENLRTYLGKLTRNLALNRLRDRTAGKRGGGQAEAALEELEEIVSGGDDVQAQAELRELTQALNDFIRALPRRRAEIFLRRYWHFDTPGEIAERFHMTEGAVTASLGRTRGKLREYLRKRGFEL